MTGNGRRLRHISLAAALAFALLLPTVPAVAQQPAATDAGQMFQSGGDEFVRFRGMDGPGMQARAGHLGFRTFGRDESISNVELMPYYYTGDEMLFGTIRMFMSNRAEFGGNAGFGYRLRLTEWWDRVIGASVWYDGDNTTGEYFQQVGVSFETYGDYVDFRSNLYFPVGRSDRVMSRTAFNQQFVGHSLIYDLNIRTGTAMRGFDYEFAVPIPGEFLENRNVRIAAGGYHFYGSGADDINGFRSRIEGDVIPSVQAQVELTTDRTFGTNVMLGVQWAYAGGFRREPGVRTQPDRMGEWVRRNYNVIVARGRETRTGLTAIDPTTGQEYVFQHVSDNGNSDGSVDNPWQTIADAQAAGGIIIVHADSVFDEAVTLQPGQILLGEGNGVEHYLAVQGAGNVLLPRASSGTSRPVIENVAGDAVTLASGSVFAGFTIDSPTGYGIVGSGLTDARVYATQISNAVGGGVFLQNVSGNVLMTQMEIVGTGGAAVEIDGGDAQIGFRGTITNSSGRSVDVRNTTDGVVDFSGSTISDDGGEGIRLADNDGNVILDGVTLKNTSGAGIQISGGDGDVAFLHTTKVKDAAGTGVAINGTAGVVTFDKLIVDAAAGQQGLRIIDAPGDVVINNIDVTSDGATAVHIRDSGRVGILAGKIAATDGTAVDLEDTEMDIRLTRVDSSNADYGVRLVNAPGRFTVSGGTNLGSGGTITGTDVAVHMENAGTVAFRWAEFEGNELGIRAISSERLVLNFSLFAENNGLAIDAHNLKTLETYGLVFKEHTAAGVPLVHATVSAAGNYAYSLIGSSFDHAHGDLIHIENVAGGEGATLNLLADTNVFTFSAADSSALRVDWNGQMRAEVINSLFTGSGGSNVGVDVLNAAGNKHTEVIVANNDFNITGSNGIAAQIDLAGSSAIGVAQNKITLAGADSTGLRFDLATSNDVLLVSNAITINNSGGTGILFSSISGPSQVGISDNKLTLGNANHVPDAGIVFSSVPSGLITLSGPKNNTVLNATTPFFAPLGTTSGRILVNNVLVP